MTVPSMACLFYVLFIYYLKWLARAGFTHRILRFALRARFTREKMPSWHFLEPLRVSIVFSRLIRFFVLFIYYLKWLARAGLNRGPPPCQGGALPLSYAPSSNDEERNRKLFKLAARVNPKIFHTVERSHTCVDPIVKDYSRMSSSPLRTSSLNLFTPLNA